MITAPRFTSRHIFGDDVSPDPDGELVAYAAFESLQTELLKAKDLISHMLPAMNPAVFGQTMRDASKWLRDNA